MAGLYFHIPYCRQACHYCDFHFSTQRDTQSAMVRAMAEELRIQQSYFQHERVATVYYGGGTPSLLTRNELLLLSQTVNHLFGADANREVTYEVNPDDLDLETLANLREAGGNRLSIGIQSFNDDVLRFFNRSHDAASALASVERGRQAGFGNISLDLIFAVPGQTAEAWGEEVATAISLEPEHISAYSLTVEDKTVFGRWQKQGRFSPVSEEESAAQLDILCDRLAGAGYERYEVSNFARAGYESKHNSSYWKLEKYLGIGPGAHSYDLVSRQWNVKNNNQYLKSLQQGLIPFEREELSRNERVNDYLLTSLRTRTGCSLKTVGDTFGVNLEADRGSTIDALLSRGLAEMEGNALRLTRRGLMLADRIAQELFL